MGQQNRSVLYKALKAKGWEPEQRYSFYSEEALRTLSVEHEIDPEQVISSARAATTQYRDRHQVEAERKAPAPRPDTPRPDPERVGTFSFPEPLAEWTLPASAPQPQSAPRSNTPDPDELPGQRLNTPVEVIRIDDQGREWYQEEVRKPAYPKPRGRRVLTYLDPGVKTETIKSGEYVETFEVSGDRMGRSAEVKITLPSYQVGIYKDPRFPFKVHTYNDHSGFSLHEVEEYFGGADLVPRTCRRIYIENDMCYDIRSVIQTIDAMYRELVLRGQA